MSAVRVGRTQQRVLDDGRHETSVRVRYGDDSRRVWFRTDASAPFVEHNQGDLWLAPLLLFAMRRGETLRLADPISADRREQLREIQDIFTTWYPTRMTRVRLVAPPSDEPRHRRWSRVLRPSSAAAATATCFTGGVDSFYSLEKHSGSVGALVYGFGIDISLRKVEAITRVRGQLADVAAESHTRLLTADTNIKPLLRQELNWRFESHGATLVSLGTVFSPLVSTLLVPATHSYADQVPWGSHPLIDPLWSTPRLRVVHDGAEASRVDKIVRLADDPVAQRNLRVCYGDYGSDTNCGRCMKCLRTMATLALVDRLEKFVTFPVPLDLDLLGSLPLETDNDVVQMRDTFQLAERVQGHDELRAVLGAILDDARRREAAGVRWWRPGDPRPTN